MSSIYIEFLLSDWNSMHMWKQKNCLQNCLHNRQQPQCMHGLNANPQLPLILCQSQILWYRRLLNIPVVPWDRELIFCSNSLEKGKKNYDITACWHYENTPEFFVAVHFSFINGLVRSSVYLYTNIEIKECYAKMILLATDLFHLTIAFTQGQCTK